MHHLSYLAALNLAFPRGRIDPLPQSPLVIDLGCGPATTLLALADWLLDRRRCASSLSYIGLDTSQPLLQIGRHLAQSPELFDNTCSFLMHDASTPIGLQAIVASARGRDGVIFALSYVVHQAFMQDMSVLAELMRLVQSATSRLPAWFLLQDANRYVAIGSNEQQWPETRINKLANQTLKFGYRIRAGYDNKTIFSSPRLRVSPDGTFEIGEIPEKKNVCHFFQRIA